MASIATPLYNFLNLLNLNYETKQMLPNPAVTKRYFSKIAGSCYTFPDGFQIHFHHGRYDFNSNNFPGEFVGAVVNGKDHPLTGKPLWQVYFDELEYLVNTGNPLVFQQGSLPVDTVLPPQIDPTKNAQSEAAVKQADASMFAKGTIREMGELNKAPSTGPSDPNASAVDRELQSRLLSPKSVGPGAAKAAELRAQAEAKALTQHTQNTTGMG